MQQTEILNILAEHLGDKVSSEDLGKVASKLAELDPAWEEVNIPCDDLGYSVLSEAQNVCSLCADTVENFRKYRFFRRRQQ